MHRLGHRLFSVTLVIGLALAAVGTVAVAPAGAAPGDPGSISGIVRGEGGTRLAGACVAVIPANLDFSLIRSVQAGADGSYELSGLDTSTQYYVGSLPNWSTPACDTSGPPPIPGPGDIQPVFYDNVWFDMSTWLTVVTGGDPAAIAAFLQGTGATLVSAGSTGINVCLTTAPGTVVPRPPCTGPSITGTVLGAGGVPFPNPCVSAVNSTTGLTLAGESSADGTYVVGNLETGASYYLVFGACPANAPADSGIQPVLYNNVWFDLSQYISLAEAGDPGALIAFLATTGATPVVAGTAAVNACLTAAPGAQVPRPACVAAAPTTAAAPTLPRTGAGESSVPLGAIGATAAFVGLALTIGARRRRALR